MMKHGEAYSRVKTPVCQRHLRCVLAQNAYIIGRTAAELVRVGRVDLYAGHVLDLGTQDIGCYARPGSNLQNIRTESQALERPGHGIVLDDVPPLLGTAQPAVDTIHGSGSNIPVDQLTKRASPCMIQPNKGERCAHVRASWCRRPEKLRTRSSMFASHEPQPSGVLLTTPCLAQFARTGYRSIYTRAFLRPQRAGCGIGSSMP
jgi:hypothetical protein